MSTKVILSAVDTQNGGANVNIKRFISGELCYEQNTSITYEELFEDFDFRDSFEDALFYMYILDEQISAYLEREDFDFEINYFDPCMQP